MTRESAAKQPYQGFRTVVRSASTGAQLYVSNQSPAKRAWDFLERGLLPPRSRDIVMSRFPGKQLWDLLALGQLVVRPDFNWRQKMGCLRFYFDAGQISNLYACMARSGSSWSQLVLDIAIDLRDGGSGEYVHDREFWVPSGGTRYTKLDWRTPAGTIDEALLGASRDPLYYQTRLPYSRVRYRNVGGMNVVVLVRSVLESLESRYFKQAGSPEWPEITADDPDTFPWDVHLDDLIEFYNSWGDYARRRSQCLVLRYQDVKSDQLGTHAAICEQFGWKVPEECIAEALRRTSKSAMSSIVKKEERESNLRVSFRRKRGVLPDRIRTRILSRLQRELIYDFGYDYSDNHEYDRYYD